MATKNMATKNMAAFEHFLRRLSPAVVETLTPEQLEELKKAVCTIQPSHHAVDIRLTIPFPKRGFYLTIFAGRERRSLERLRQEMPNLAYRSAIGSLVVIGALAACTVPSILWLTQLHRESQNQEIHPTAIPWLQDQPSCERTGRVWEDNQCWDSEWSHEF